MGPLISVVVPVYNVEQYLKQCVDSIRNQTYGNLEIILVDDGSSDNCPAMCDKFAEDDPRIKVIHQENKGLSDARNAGTSFATGSYIIYVDSDDWIHIKTISYLYEILKESQADISVCEYQKVKDKPHEVKEKANYVIYGKEEILEKWMYQKIKTSTCGTLFPAWVCKEISFPSGRLYEDLFTVYMFYYKCKLIAYTKRDFYFYRQNPDSIMHKKFSYKMFDELDAAEEIVSFAKKCFPNLLPAAYSRKFSVYSQVLRWMPFSTKDNDLWENSNEIWSFLKQYHWKMMLDRKARIKNRIGACCVCLGRKIFQNL